MGQVYLIHFDTPVAHAQHYVGYVNGDGPNDLARRIDRHAASNGARLLAVCNARLIPWRVVRVWRNVDRRFERQIKRAKSTRAYCPVCAATNGRNARTRKEPNANN
jgi:hypothetical protein